MTAIASTALAGMNAAQLRVDIAGHNVANAATPGYRRQVPVQGEGPAVSVGRAPAAPAAWGDALAEDVVAQRQAEHVYTANLQVLRTSDRMLGSLLDARA